MDVLLHVCFATKACLGLLGYLFDFDTWLLHVQISIFWLVLLSLFLTLSVDVCFIRWSL